MTVIFKWLWPEIVSLNPWICSGVGRGNIALIRDCGFPFGWCYLKIIMELRDPGIFVVHRGVPYQYFFSSRYTLNKLSQKCFLEIICKCLIFTFCIIMCCVPAQNLNFPKILIHCHFFLNYELKVIQMLEKNYSASILI